MRGQNNVIELLTDSYHEKDVQCRSRNIVTMLIIKSHPLLSCSNTTFT